LPFEKKRTTTPRKPNDFKVPVFGQRLKWKNILSKQAQLANSG
jgi:hypothetical protein